MKRIHVIASILLLLIIILNVNLLISPENNSKTTDRKINFRFIGFADQILIDNNKEFSSPEIINKPFAVYLKPDSYYWTTSGLSNINQFIIESEIAVKLIEKGNGTYVVQNEGNMVMDILFRKLKDWSATGASVLQIDEPKEIEVKEGTVIIASQK